MAISDTRKFSTTILDFREQMKKLEGYVGARGLPKACSLCYDPNDHLLRGDCWLLRILFLKNVLGTWSRHIRGCFKDFSQEEVKKLVKKNGRRIEENFNKKDRNLMTQLAKKDISFDPVVGKKDEEGVESDDEGMDDVDDGIKEENERMDDGDDHDE
ncbi:hypothetical protein Tco_1087451 [Tanacetum coccineum]